MTVRITDSWVPLPESVLTALGWPDGTVLDIELFRDTLVLTKAASQAPVTHPLPMKKGKSL